MKSKQRKAKQPKHPVILKLTNREVDLLTGLVDFPDWSAQDDEHSDFLERLYDELHKNSPAGSYSEPAKAMGYVPVVSFEADEE